eukprot:TRINITY_DN80979_c0_g1_i1.p1 TRINITY_DN80979_c0_g1~~TRINITY_DN80979_c0_g1_i1.p1  ORF type:complete len:717 (-),score=140.06 TRINITY_DN80979_c0_g1_i1:257-2335(-)
MPWGSAAGRKEQHMSPEQMFAARKERCLGKMDKSSAGRIDARAVEICGVLNALDEYYTTSSCAGRCLLWRGAGRKDARFERFRVNHDLVEDADAYFSAVITESAEEAEADGELGPDDPRHGVKLNDAEALDVAEPDVSGDAESDGTLWLRFEPFILHVCCIDLDAASRLMAAARSVFKNVGMQGWREGKHMVAIWGDEGLEMPLTVPGTAGAVPLFPSPEQKEWLKRVTNEKHARNWAKIDRLVAAVRDMAVQQAKDYANRGACDADAAGAEMCGVEDATSSAGCERCGFVAPTGSKANKASHVPRHYDVIGDVALLNNIPAGWADDEAALTRLGEAVLKTNPGKLKVCAVRLGALESDEKRVPVRVLAGPTRSPLVTTHKEFGVAYVVDIGEVFFTPRMELERLRLCNSVGRGEDVCVLFSGCGPEVLQVAARTEARSVLGIELNPTAVACARKGVELLRGRNKPNNPAAADKITVREGDVYELLPSLPRGCFDRVIAPRPKGVDASENGGGGDGGSRFLDLLLPTLRSGAECHWYDFAAEGEVPACERTRQFLQEACKRHGLRVEILHSGLAGKKSIATRQFRVCVDFRVHAEGEAAEQIHGANVVTKRMLESTSKQQVLQRHGGADAAVCVGGVESTNGAAPGAKEDTGASGAGEKTFDCDKCGRIFASRNALFRHVHQYKGSCKAGDP